VLRLRMGWGLEIHSAGMPS